MEGHQRGHGVGQGGQVVGQAGWADLLQVGVAGGPLGLWGEQWGAVGRAVGAIVVTRYDGSRRADCGWRMSS